MTLETVHSAQAVRHSTSTQGPLSNQSELCSCKQIKCFPVLQAYAPSEELAEQSHI